MADRRGLRWPAFFTILSTVIAIAGFVVGCIGLQQTIQDANNLGQPTTEDWDILVIGFAVFYLFVYVSIAAYARHRQRPFFPVFLGCLLLGPFGPGAALLMVAVTSKVGS